MQEQAECGVAGEKTECVGDLQMLTVQSSVVNMCTNCCDNNTFLMDLNLARVCNNAEFNLWLLKKLRQVLSKM